jgi:hypothetical protein
MSKTFYVQKQVFEEVILEKAREYRAKTGVVVGWKEGKKVYVFDVFMTPEPLESTKLAQMKSDKRAEGRSLGKLLHATYKDDFAFTEWFAEFYN